MSQRLDDTKAAFDGFRKARDLELEQRRATPGLFDQPVEAITEAHQSVTATWVRDALDAVRAAASSCQEFTIDFVEWPDETGVDRKARGSVMRAASLKGWIEAGGWVDGGAERHGRPIRAWQSLIYRSAA